MERGNTKHGPRLDEQLGREVRGHTRGSLAGSRAEETREPEPPADREPEPSTVPRPDPRPRTDADLTMTDEELEGRSRLGRYLPRSVFPADRRTMLAAARAGNAPDDVMEQIERLPQGVVFATVARAWAALGHPIDQRF